MFILMIIFREFAVTEGLSSQSLTNGEEDSPPDDLSAGGTAVLPQAAGAQESRSGPWPSQGPALVQESWAGILDPSAPGQHLSLQRPVLLKTRFLTLFASSPVRAMLPRAEARPTVTPGCPISSHSRSLRPLGAVPPLLAWLVCACLLF